VSFLRDLFDRSPKTKAEFAAFAAGVLMGEFPQSPIDIDEANFSLRHAHGTAFLDNVYVTYTQTPTAARAAMMARWARGIGVRVTIPETFAEAEPRIMPQVRPYEALWIPAYDRTASYAYVPVAGDLVATLVYDLPDSTMSVGDAHLDRWGVSLQTAFDSAMRNLRRHSADAWREVADGVFQSNWNDDYDATRILFPDLLHRTGVAGRPVVMAPERNTLLVTSERDVDGLGAFLQRGWSLYDAIPYRRSAQPFVLDGDVLTPLELTEGLAAEADRRHKVRQAQTYADQAKAKEADFGDIFWASLKVFDAADGSLCRSVAIWSPAVALLPKADFIAFIGHDLPMLSVPWDDAVAILGPLAEDPNLRPVRYRVNGLPSSEHLARLSERARPLG